MRHILLSIALVLFPLLAVASEPVALPKPAYLMDRVKARAVLADPACVKQKGDVPACQCAIETVYPRFITANAAKPATATTNAVPAEPANPNALPKAEELNQNLKEFVDLAVEEGVCAINYSEKRSGNPHEMLDKTLLATTLGYSITFQKGEYVGITYRYFDRDVEEFPLLQHRGILLNTKTGDAYNLPDLLGVKQDDALNREVTQQLKAKARETDIPTAAKPFTNGKCPGCLGYYYTPAGLTVEMFGIGKNEEPVVVDIQMPNKLIADPKLRALFAPQTPSK